MKIVRASTGPTPGEQRLHALQGEATLLAKDYIVKQIHGVGWPPLTEVLAKVVDHGVPIYIGGGCAVARGVTEQDLHNKHGRFVTPKDGAEFTVAADRVFNYGKSCPDPPSKRIMYAIPVCSE